MDIKSFIILISLIYGLAVTILVFIKILKKYIVMGDSKGSSYDFAGINMEFINKQNL